MIFCIINETKFTKSSSSSSLFVIRENSTMTACPGKQNWRCKVSVESNWGSVQQVSRAANFQSAEIGRYKGGTCALGAVFSRTSRCVVIIDAKLRASYQDRMRAVLSHRLMDGLKIKCHRARTTINYCFIDRTVPMTIDHCDRSLALISIDSLIDDYWFLLRIELCLLAARDVYNRRGKLKAR